MCDGCGCDLPKAPGDETRRVREKDAGWHVHADGTVHRHDQPHDHSHPYARGPAPRGSAKREPSQPDPESFLG